MLSSEHHSRDPDNALATTGKAASVPVIGGGLVTVQRLGKLFELTIRSRL